MTFLPHVLLLNVYYAPQSYGGATVVAEAVAQQLVRRHGWRVTVVSTFEHSGLVPYSVMRTEANGVQNHMINLPHNRTYADRYDNPNVTEIVSGIISDTKPDLIHVHCMQDLGIGALHMAKAQGLPLVLSVHDFWWLCDRQFMIRPNGKYCGQNPIQIENCHGCVDNMSRARVRFSRLQEAAALADLITYPSAFARSLSVASGFPPEPSVVWQNGVRRPDDSFFAAQAARRARNPQVVFGFLGGPSQIKGWPLIKAAFETLDTDDFAGFLVDASLDGTWWKDIKINKLQGDWAIHPRFSQETIDDFYAKIDVLLFPSQWKETFGLTVREALSRGIYVIQTDSGGTSEWDGADPQQMLQIGDGPDKLQAQIMQVLEQGKAHPKPRAVTDYAQQADALVGLTAPLLGAPLAKT